MIFLTKSFSEFARTLIVLHRFWVFFCFSLILSNSTVNAQAYCNNPLGNLSPTLTWQTFNHTCRGYVSFQAQAGCTYQFTYCSAYAPG
ncbi:MAG: hypothetical protein RL365_1182, partial [Bacteroidota bacterium]